MTDFAVLTPSYAPDAGLFEALHRSVLDHTDAVHHVVVPPVDRGLFARYEGGRCRIWTYPELLPKRYLATPKAGVWLNARRPWPPVRGWVLQQAVKLAAASRFDARAVLMMDSDVVLIRHTTAESFAVNGRIGLFRAENAVHAGMPRHVRWHAVARELLGLPPAPDLPLPDYVSPFNVWEPAVVRLLQDRVQEVTGKSWLDLFTGRLHISEFILYGVFADEVLGGTIPRVPSDSLYCHTYWDNTPLDEAGAREFAGRLAPDALAVMISAKSGTSPENRHVALAACEAAVSPERQD
ncbi:DUF6492 family protein [Amycolatopsis magusensis]|uniref:Uncharacterized protein n=1 Tax=Amycolatopsis magusensis TaxID=882444 RepID=A0ABS4PLM3_9PSEU|nr:DUF6492 family protein [Amycolatopsis magusensis]MBP2180322.1 hypothetical protein [Amycolatopsis magusensis]